MWDHSQTNWIDSIVQSGYHQFCYPPPLSADRPDNSNPVDAEEKKDDSRRKPHTWSFLHMMSPVYVKVGKSLYDLPDDYVGIQGDFVVETEGANGRIPTVPEAQLRTLLAKNQDMATPEYAAIRPRKTPQGQRYDLLLYPTPDADITLNMRYAVAVEDLSEDNPFPFGGRQHAETILASCLAVAEERSDGAQGQKYAKFMERLRASVHLDKQSEPTQITTWKNDGDTVGNTLKSLVGLHMGFGQNEDAWTESQRQEILQIMREGRSRVYTPTIPGRKDSHEWSFLAPLQHVTTVSGSYSYDLPDDFGGFSTLGGSPMTYKAGDNVIYPSITITGEHHIRRLLQQTVQATGRPVKAGYGQKSGAQQGAGYELFLWPVPDAAYTLSYRYRVAPGPDPTVIYGGDAHFQTFLEAMKAAADVYLRRRNKPHEALFQERLVASIRYDQQLISPPTMGYNRDSSSRLSGGIYDDRHRAGWGEGAVSYNGNLYS